ncbi:lipopolysaccharide biosynthesis protein [Actinoallomurus rhizosphaericola]|uniref:lipopolysaccharide biosynthesis protein n=1 Tax=Actinoallomurus rhizosphaericola TaxID=2952536 RepID=UPI002093C5BD|nr:polysaccharide biosynthesis C-terminal domain-containing protein [Actinoallomurus rhizosphaericola]MCO5998419.1 polysaccharide biosynthesis C-terminal domain-containing protein [Actinoallomurus rhizosphaericola]
MNDAAGRRARPPDGHGARTPDGGATRPPGGPAIRTPADRATRTPADRATRTPADRATRTPEDRATRTPDGRGVRSLGGLAVRTLGSYGVRFVLGALMSVVVNRSLGPEGRGAYAVLIAVATVALHLGQLSVEEAHVALWSRIRDAATVTANSVLFGAALGCVCAVGAAIVVVGLGPGVVPVPGLGLLAVALAWIPCAMTEKLLARLMVLRTRIEVNNRSGLLSVGVHCASLVLLAALGEVTLGWVVALWTVSAALPLVVLLPAARPALRHCDLAVARRTLRLGLRYHTGLVSMFLLLRADVLILGAMTTTAEVGLYAVAVTLMELGRVPPDVLANLAMPRQLEDDERAAALFTVRSTRIAALVAAGSVGLLCAAAPLLVPAVYGPAFTGAVGPLLALAPGLWSIGASRPVGAFLLRLDRPLWNSMTAVAALTVNVAVNLALIPSCGAVGAALASSVAYTVLAVLQVLWFLRVTRRPWSDLLPRCSDVRFLWATACRVPSWRAG